MNDLKQYIIEKLKINKNSKLSSKEIYDDELVNIIKKYLEDNKYFDYNIKDFKIKYKSNSISLFLPKGINMENMYKIGEDIEKIINDKLKLGWMWSYKNINRLNIKKITWSK